MDLLWNYFWINLIILKTRSTYLHSTDTEKFIKLNDKISTVITTEEWDWKAKYFEIYMWNLYCSNTVSLFKFLIRKIHNNLNLYSRKNKGVKMSNTKGFITLPSRLLFKKAVIPSQLPKGENLSSIRLGRWERLSYQI